MRFEGKVVTGAASGIGLVVDGGLTAATGQPNFNRLTRK